MTWTEIERRLTKDTSTAARAELWDSLYLPRNEIAALLEHVNQNAAYGWIYPMFCFVGHTGARRSEMLRVQIPDVDFEAMTVIIREKKRKRKHRTTRRVPLSPFLAEVLKEWLTEHPGGQFLFCHPDEVSRSKKGVAPRGTCQAKIDQHRARDGRRR